MDDVFAQMTATADMPAASLAQIDSLFSMMLDTLERCAFFFLDNELKQENGPLHLAHHTHLRARLIDGLNALAEQGFFIESFTPEVCQTLIQILLMSHMTWLKQTVRGTDKNAMSKTEFLRAHWLVLGPYLTEKGREAYRAMRPTEN